MEYLDIYDENKRITDLVIDRAKIKTDLKPDQFIRIILIFIQNSNGDLLIQMTSKEKGSVWATTGGFVKSGSTAYGTVVVETKEELGIDISSDDIKDIGQFKRGQALFDVFYLKKDISLDELVYQKEEVDYAKWLSFDKINELIKEGKFRESNILGLNILMEYLNNN